MSTSSAQAETLPFKAEVNQLLSLVVNSLYSHKEIFLRELVSNASDALGKLQFRGLTEPSLRAGGGDLEIRIRTDRDKGTLTIEDAGIGMTRDALVLDLGTIARSGSKVFLEEFGKAGTKDLSLIGQFGVGFYSAYLVADRVEVVSRAAGSDEAWKWTSDAKSSFTIEPAERSERGTTITLHLKDDQKEYVDEWRVRELVRRYSDFVSFPIRLEVDKKGVKSWETINQGRALWKRPKNEVTDAEYQEFYKHLTSDYDGPLTRVHFTVEGTNEFTVLLYVPKKPPYDLYQQHAPRGVRLFVQRVFIMDDCEEILPLWLRFARGVVDTNDLPLNVSREILQDSRVTRTMKKTITRKLLEHFDELAKDRAADYATFWEHYGPVLKEGLHFDPEHKDRILPLLRYETSRDEGWVSLATYVERMPAAQEAIYYIAGPSKKTVATSPHLEALRAKGFEVLLMTDPVDEFAVGGLDEFQGKKFVSAMKADLGLAATDEEKKTKEERSVELRGLLDRIRAVLQDRVSEIRISDRLTDSPACLVVPEGGLAAHMERLMRQYEKNVPVTKRILEINPAHAIVTGMKALHEKDAKGERLTEWIEVLYDQSLLGEGSPLTDPNEYVRRVNRLLAEAVR